MFSFVWSRAERRFFADGSGRFSACVRYPVNAGVVLVELFVHYRGNCLIHVLHFEIVDLTNPLGKHSHSPFNEIFKQEACFTQSY